MPGERRVTARRCANSGALTPEGRGAGCSLSSCGLRPGTRVSLALGVFCNAVWSPPPPTAAGQAAPAAAHVQV